MTHNPQTPISGVSKFTKFVLAGKTQETISNLLTHEPVYRLSHNGKAIILVGTAHISRESPALVERAITAEMPDTVYRYPRNHEIYLTPQG